MQCYLTTKGKLLVPAATLMKIVCSVEYVTYFYLYESPRAGKSIKMEIQLVYAYG